MQQSERRTAITEEIAIRTGIDEAMIELLVHRFYDVVREDPLLGPIFIDRIQDWDTHLAKMCAFWSSVALMSGRYHGQPMAKHMPLPVDSRHFDRWLTLFVKTAERECPPAAAEHFIKLAQNIAGSLELGVAGQHGILLQKQQRLHRSDSDVFLPQ